MLLRYNPRRQKCPSQAPRGLQLFTSEGTLVATLERNVTFLVFLEEVLTSRYKATVVCIAWIYMGIYMDLCCMLLIQHVVICIYRDAV